MKIIDWYILKRFLMTFLFTLLILVPITIAIDVAEKVDKFVKNDELTFTILIDEYYKNFIIYFGNTFMPLALFLAVIIFTSRLANNTEIIAINDAQVSFTRFLYPYFIGATLITIFALMMNHFIVPNSNKVRKNFEKVYLGQHQNLNIIQHISLQLNDSTFIYLRSYSTKDNSGYQFSIAEYNDRKLKTKIIANNIQWKPKDSIFKLLNWKKRIVLKNRDILSQGNTMDTTFVFTPRDFIDEGKVAQEIPTPELRKFIKVLEKRGVTNLNTYAVELYNRTSLPLASYILTLIAVGLSYRKRRGGIGVNLAIGVAVMFIYVFALRIGGVLGSVAGASPMLNVWMPNIVFGCLALYLYLNARK